MNHQKINSEKYIVFTLLALSLICWIIISLLSEGNPMDADAYQHYMYSRYSFQHPELLLHHWAKPVYTLLSAPFSQFGFQGAKFFSILTGILTAWFTWRVAALAKLNYRPLVIFFVIFTPYYALLMISSMTETLFSFFLILSIFFYLKNHTISAAMVVSFIPFVRSEGWAIIFAFLVVMLLNKKWKALPFLLTGLLIYSTIGAWYLGDFFWVFTQSPYNPSGVEYYGKGELSFYFVNSDIIFGHLLQFLILVGTLFFILKYIKGIIHKNNAVPYSTELLLLIPGIFFGFIFMQSYMWYKGLMGVYGSYRFIVCIVPLGALLALYAVNTIPPALLKRKWMQFGLMSLLGAAAIVITFKRNPFPYGLSPSQQVKKEVADYIKQNQLDAHKIWYADVAYFYFLDQNPYDNSKIELMGSGRAAHEFSTLPGDYLIWDQQFSPNELSLPIERLLQSSQFRMVKEFDPAIPFITFNNINYRVVLFERKEPDAADTLFIPVWDSIQAKFNLKREKVNILEFNPYEGPFTGRFKYHIKKVGDNQALSINGSNPYLPIIDHPLERITNMNPTEFYIGVDATILAETEEANELNLIISVDKDGKLLKYIPVDLHQQLNKPGEKGKIYYHTTFDASAFNPGDNLKIYFWRVKGSELLMDNTVFITQPAK